MKTFQIETRLTADENDKFALMIDADSKPLQYTMPEIMAFAADLSKQDWIDFEWRIVPVAHHGRAEPQDLQRLFTEFTRRVECQPTTPRNDRREAKRFWTEVSPHLIYAAHIPGLTVPVNLPAEVVR